MFNTLLILSDFERHSKIKEVIDDSIRFYWQVLTRDRPRFFDQVGHQTTYASIENYEQSRQKLGTFIVNKVL